MTAPRVQVAIALGSNLDNRFELLRSGSEAVAELAGVDMLRASCIEDTEAIGPAQPSFLNQMLLVETGHPLPVLMRELHGIERQHGRVRSDTKGPRTLDLDIVWADGVVITSDELLVPHPGLNDRQFWQRELAELLGVDAATDAIASAQVHAGMDTARPTA